MSEKQIHNLRMRWAEDDGVKNVRAQAEVLHSDGRRHLITSVVLNLEVDPIDDPSRMIIERQLIANLREKLFAAGFSKDYVDEAEYASLTEPDFVEPKSSRRNRSISSYHGNRELTFPCAEDSD